MTNKLNLKANLSKKEKKSQLTALLRKLKRETQAAEINWDLQVNYVVKRTESELYSKLNQALEKGELKMEVDIFLKDKQRERIETYHFPVSGWKYELETTKSLNDFKIDLNQVVKASQRLIKRVKERDPSQEKHVQEFLVEWQKTMIKHPPLSLSEIEQSVKYVYQNQAFVKGLVKKALIYQNHILENEITAFIQD